jgi:2-keto-3-deoxy-L-rhamnonate aldolase RhmA
VAPTCGTAARLKLRWLRQLRAVTDSRTQGILRVGAPPPDLVGRVLGFGGRMGSWCRRSTPPPGVRINQRGILVRDLSALHAHRDLGFTYLAVESDLAILRKACQ